MPNTLDREGPSSMVVRIVLVAVMALSVGGCGQATSDSPPAASTPNATSGVVDGYALQPADDADVAAATAVLREVAREQGLRVDKVVHATDVDPIVPTKWWAVERTGKPYKVIVLRASGEYNIAGQQWWFWKAAKDSEWEFVERGKG